MFARHPSVLLDRSAECRALDALLADVRGGQSGVLVIRGEPGVGKTALMRHCAAKAEGFRCAQLSGVESEMELPLAALHQLCAPLLGDLDALPPPQQGALRVAFGLAAGAPPDAFLVGLATLSLLAEAAASGPFLCLVDDAQWLDGASAQALGFAARRLLAESVAFVFAIRDEPKIHALAGLPELALGGLPERFAHDLLRTVIPGRLDDGLRDRVIAESRGNPLALLELPRDLAATELPVRGARAPAQPLSGRIEGSFLRRLERLPAETRRLLLIAAAEPVGDSVVLWRAAERLGIDLEAASSDTDGVLTIGERVAFLHPLVRSAVYRSAAAPERRAVHLALAEATDRQIDPDRRAWHLAAAAPASDEDVASELERSAARAQTRGGLAAAAAFLRRSTELTRDPARRTQRALAAAQASLHAGEFEAALTMVSTARAGAVGEHAAAQADLLRAQVTFAAGLGTAAPPLLLEAARRLEPLDPDRARETYLEGIGAAMLAGPDAAPLLLEIAHGARALPARPGEPRAVDLLLEGLALLVTEGHAAAAATLFRATDAFLGGGASLEDSLRWGWAATSPSDALWEDRRMRDVCERQIRLTREVGALAALPLSLVAYASFTARAGSFAEVASLAAQAEAIADATGMRMAPYAALMLRAAVAGDEAELDALVRITVEGASATGHGIAVTVTHWVTAVLYNGLGRYEQAQHAAERAAETPGDLFAAVWALPELIEAAVHRGETERAHEALARLERTTQGAGTDFGVGVEARSRALLSHGERADALYREAIERLGRTLMRSELARAHLVHGEWLRREGRRKDGRGALRTAHEQFTGMGMGAFAQRASRELLATGARVRSRTVDSRDELTPQETEIARLARDGLSNPEIGSRLFLSPRTVEWHLRKVFTKLDIVSRQQLAITLPE
jgi:DNA-binding CsgD family transcriptional regulator/tetratricopeptide (TPR) repeat protein